MFKLLKIISILILGINTIYASDDLQDSDEEYSYAELSNKCAVYDPYQNLNRKIFKFNNMLDQIIITPLGKTYGVVTNDYIRGRFHNFFLNIHEPITSINYAAQKDTKKFLTSFWRFTLNSTLGVLGIFDIAAKFGLKAEPKTFSSTLAYYGLASGPYIVIPLFGGYNVRDIIDLVSFEFILNPFIYTDNKIRITENVIRTSHYRHRAFPFTDHLYKNSLDPYIALRDAAVNSRESKMHYPEGYICPHPNK
ncbi:MAG: VacJ family lipoprotein [Rickettsiaceae bacterium]|nr:VacJ family lipoprotein [Rickettsiaceae bacterium]